MAITYGFFNSLNGDRVYNADQMSTYFKGLIGQGVFEDVGGALQVLANSGMTVQVQTGRAIVGPNLKWLENDAPYNVSINASHVTLNRYTAVVVQCDVTNRTVSIGTVDGTPATTPTKPAMTNTTTIQQICLAYVYVKAGATAITQANITDTRPNSAVCGWITGLINQVDTSTLFAQWQTAYEEFYAQMEAWEIQQKNAFDAWFQTLTDELQIGAYVKAFSKTATITSTTPLGQSLPLDMANYTYDDTDVFLVYINGLMAESGTDYSINSNLTPPYITFHMTNPVSETVDIKVIKSILGVSS